MSDVWVGDSDVSEVFFKIQEGSGKLKMISCEYVSPGRRMEDGKADWLGESGNF